MLLVRKDGIGIDGLKSGAEYAITSEVVLGEGRIRIGVCLAGDGKHFGVRLTSDGKVYPMGTKLGDPTPIKDGDIIIWIENVEAAGGLIQKINDVVSLIKEREK